MPLLLPVIVTEPAVLCQRTAPVVVKPEQVLEAEFAPTNLTDAFPNVIVPLFVTFPVKETLPAPV